MLIDDGLLPASFLTQYDQTSRLNTKVNGQPERYRKCFENLMKFSIKLCRLKLDESYERLYRSRDDADPKLPKRQLSKEHIWPVFAVFYVYFTIKLIYINCGQYTVDFYLYKLEKFDRALEHYRNRTHLTPGLIESTRNQLVSDFEEARKSLKMVGAPYINVHYVLENAFIFLIIVCYGIYMNLLLYYSFCKPFDFSIVYTVLAPEKLQLATNFIVHNMVNNFIVSSRNFNELLIAKEESDVVKLQWCQEDLRCRDDALCPKEGVVLDMARDEDGDEQMVHKFSLKLESETSKIIRNHKFLVEQVKLMATRGVLQPFNRRPDWLQRLAEIYQVAASTTYILVVGCIVLIMFLLPYIPLFIAYNVETEPMDMVLQAEIFLYSWILVTSATLYIIILAMTCLDQGHLVKALNALIHQCIITNTNRLKEFIDNADMRVYINPLSTTRCMSLAHDRRKSLLRSPIRNPSLINILPDTAAAAKGLGADIAGNLLLPDIGLISEQSQIACIQISYDLIDKAINYSLMHTLMHYKIFVRQLRPKLDSIPYYVTTIMIVMYASIVIPRTLIAYLDKDMKAASLLVAVITLTLCHIVLLMVCFMHSRCLRIYKHLQSLLAHTISMDHIVKQQIGRKVYDRHLIWMLRRELHHPYKLTDQFTVHMMAGRSRMTFSSLIKYDFWWGFIALSTVILDPTIPNASDIFGSAWKYYSAADVFVDQFFHGNTTN